MLLYLYVYVGYSIQYILYTLCYMEFANRFDISKYETVLDIIIIILSGMNDL